MVCKQVFGVLALSKLVAVDEELCSLDKRRSKIRELSNSTQAALRSVWNRVPSQHDMSLGLCRANLLVVLLPLITISLIACGSSFRALYTPSYARLELCALPSF